MCDLIQTAKNGKAVGAAGVETRRVTALATEPCLTRTPAREPARRTLADRLARFVPSAEAGHWAAVVAMAAAWSFFICG